MINLSEIIPELIDIKKLESFSDVVKLSNFVYKFVPHGTPDTRMDIRNLRGIYLKFKRKESCGWCYANAVFMHLILREYGRDSYIYDYGLKENKITHTVIVCTIKDKNYLIDPYFSRYYCDKAGNFLTFEDLKDRINNNIDDIESVYGESEKEVHQGDKYVGMKPQKFEESVLGGWKYEFDFDTVMNEKFDSSNPLFLIPCVIQRCRVINKSDGHAYYEFF